jgi:hypothetical protein
LALQIPKAFISKPQTFIMQVSVKDVDVTDAVTWPHVDADPKIAGRCFGAEKEAEVPQEEKDARSDSFCD